MKIAQIVVAKETREGEGRVALTPSAVAALVAKNYTIVVESGAGLLAGFSDEDYLKAGARIFKFGQDKFPSQSLIVRVKRPKNARQILENEVLPPGTAMLGFLDPLDDDLSHMVSWKAQGVTPISLELLPLAGNDPRSAQAAMSRFAGRLAFQDAHARYQGSWLKRVSVFGTGPAGMSAALAAKELELPVQLFGRREAYRQKVEALGIRYQLLPSEFTLDFVRAHLREETIIIAAARSIGKRTSILIDEATLEILPEKAIVVDLCTGEGGNVFGSKKDEVVVTNRGISIVNVSGYPKAEPTAASEAFAQCMVNLLLEIAPNGEIDWDNPLLRNVRTFFN